MKCLLILSLAVVAVLAGREKRFTIGTIAVSGGGGSSGCVVTGNVLYANGIRIRTLTSSEQQELSQYQSQLDQYKDALKAALQQRSDAMKQKFNQRWNNRRNNNNNNNNNNNMNNNDLQMDSSNNVGVVSSTGSSTDPSLPQAPTKPSFCTAELTTQYLFDGCMIQDNKVYIGNQFARNLTSSEISQLKQFDTEQTAYQNYVQQQVQQQVKQVFGSSDFFSALFNQARGGQQDSDAMASSTAAPDVTASPPPQPEVPNFCTAIY